MFSIDNRTVLISFIIGTAAPSAVAEATAGYRVEVLLLRHLESTAVPRAEPELPDLSAALDLQAQAAAVAEWGEDPFYPGPPDSALRPPLGPFPGRRDRLAQIGALADRSEPMNAAWRNLRLSGEFRPEAFLAWQQPAEPPFFLLRIHNDEIIAIDDPWAPLRTARGAYAFLYDLASGHLGLAPLPAPEYHYALDGTVRLRRSRFLHLDLDLAWRAPVAGDVMGAPGRPLLPVHRGYLVHELKHSRQVRTGRMEYFDSPLLGALVWVSEIEWPDEGGPE